MTLDQLQAETGRFCHDTLSRLDNIKYTAYSIIRTSTDLNALGAENSFPTTETINRQLKDLKEDLIKFVKETNLKEKIIDDEKINKIIERFDLTKTENYHYGATLRGLLRLLIQHINTADIKKIKKELLSAIKIKINWILTQVNEIELNTLVYHIKDLELELRIFSNITRDEKEYGNRREKFNINKTIEKAISELNDFARRKIAKITLTVNSGDENWTIGNERKIFHSIYNIIYNAIQSRYGLEARNGLNIRITVSKQKKTALISFKYLQAQFHNTNLTSQEKALEKYFENRFFTDLGIPYSKKVIEDENGSLDFECKKIEGKTNHTIAEQEIKITLKLN